MADAQEQLGQFNEELEKIQNRIGKIRESFGEDLANSLQKNIDVAKELSNPLKDIQSISAALSDIQEENAVLILKQKAAQEKYLKALIESGEEAAASLETDYKKLSTQLKLNQKLEDQLDTLYRISKEEDKRNDKGAILQKVFEENFKITVDQIKKMGTLAGILDMIVKGMINANENSVWISKNLGYGAAQADIMTMKMQAMSLTSDATNVTLKSAREAMAQLATATGGVAEFSEDALKTQIMLTRQLGLSADEAAGVYKFSLLTGKESAQINDEMLEAFASTRNATKGSANFQQSMAATAKVSGQLAMKLQNNPGMIMKAVVQAQAFGTTIEQINKQGDDLLNWEQSIEKELKAELLTGKELNLERARAAALAGDQIALAEELQKNVGTLEDFQSMNVLQQKSLAEAMGLTVDELSDQLRKQKMAQEQGKSLEEVSKEELKAAEERKTIQEKFNNVMEKLMDIVGSIGTLFSPIIEAISWLLDHTWVVYGILGLWLLRANSIGSSFKGILGSIKSVGTGIMNKFLGKGAAPIAPPTPPPAAGGGIGGFMSKITPSGMIKGAAAVLILSAALFIAAKAFQEFAEVEWPAVALGTGALIGMSFAAIMLGKGQKEMIKGAIAVAILGVALIPFAYAMSLIAGLDMEAVLAAAAGLLIFGGAVFGLGALMMVPGAQFLFGAGLLALIALGGAMIILGYGMKSVAEGGQGITELFKSLTELDIAKLTAIAPALGTIGEAILKLGAGSLLAGIGEKLGGGPVGIIKGIAESGDGLQKAATGLQGVATALTQVSTALSTIDTNKLEALEGFATKMTVGSVVKGITDFITAPIKYAGSMMEGAVGGSGKGENDPLVKAINEVRDEIKVLQGKNTSINLDSVKVSTELNKTGRVKTI